MILTKSVTVFGRECLLVMIPPNWAAAVRANVVLRTQVDEAVTGVQSRTAEANALRLGLSYSAILAGAELQQLRQVISTVGDTLVLIPWWPDALRTVPAGDASDWAGRLFNGGAHLGWEGAGESVEPGSDVIAESAPARSWRCALLAGRLTRWNMTALDAGMADVRLTIIEDSPWAFRLSPAAVAPAGWQESWRINWSRAPEQDVRVLLDRGSLGRGREATIEGAPDAAFWRQQATLTVSPGELRQLLAFYAEYGGHRAFEMPSALQPGAAAAGAPHVFDAITGRVRFADKEWRIEWMHPDLAEVRVQVEQQIETVDPQERPSFAFLYQFEYAGEVLRLTDWESVVQPGAMEYDWSGGVPPSITQDGGLALSAPSSYGLTDGLLRAVNGGTGNVGTVWFGGLQPGQQYDYDIRLAGTSLWEVILPDGSYYDTGSAAWEPQMGSCVADTQGRVGVEIHNDYHSSEVYFSLVRFSSGDSWMPARIQHGKIRQALRPQNEECEIEAWLTDVPLVAPLLRADAELPVGVSIYEYDLVGGSAPAMLFTGRVIQARGQGRRVRLKCAAFAGALRRKIPRFHFSHTCNHTFLSHGCAARRPADMTVANYQTTGEFAGQYADGAVQLESITWPATLPAELRTLEYLRGYWSGGWCETGTGSQRQVREILNSWITDNWDFYIYLGRPLREDLMGQAAEVRIWPGCDGSIDSCVKYGNSVAFGGFPHIPAYIEQAPAGAPAGGK